MRPKWKSNHEVDRITCKKCWSNTLYAGKSKHSRLFIDLKPNTVIHALNCYNDKSDEDFWHQIYAGPQTMEFNREVLRLERKRLKYTQKDVANAIGASVRTYQKWESGETTPDGHYLLRLMNWLDIRDVQNVVKIYRIASQTTGVRNGKTNHVVRIIIFCRLEIANALPGRLDATY